MLTAIRRLERMRWTDLLDLYVTKAGKNLKAIQAAGNYLVDFWNLIAEPIQCRILKVAAQNNQL